MRFRLRSLSPSRVRAIPLVVLPLLVNACSHAPKAPGGSDRDPAYLAARACELGTDVRSATGSVWLKAQSKEASGQFPAHVVANSPDRLRLEVVNLIGGTEAVISVEGRRYTIHLPSKKQGQERSDEQGFNSWGGIPLRWATELFLGKVPCPSAASLKDASLAVTQEGDLRIETKPALGEEPEVFSFHFRNWSGRPWPEALHWERKATVPLAVDFKFSEPDNAGSPTRWEAKSARGEVRVRWRDRDMVR